MALTRLDELAAWPVVDIATMAAHLRLSACGEAVDAATAAQVGVLLAVATRDAENRLQRTLVPTRWRLRIDRFVPEIVLRMPPLVAVESVSYIDRAGQQQTLASSAWHLMADGDTPCLVPALGSAWPADVAALPGAVQVVYTAGYTSAAAVPEPIKQWIMLATADLHEQPSRSSDKPVVPQGFADALLDTYRVVVL